MDRPAISNFAREFTNGLKDVKFNTIVTTRMLPTIYVVGVAFAALAALYLVVNSWNENTWPSRILWTCVFAPALFIGAVTALRIMLELCLALFEMSLHVRAMSIELQKVSGTANEIATDLPRIQFWRSRKTPPETPSSDAIK